MLTDKKEIADTFNTFFQSVFKSSGSRAEVSNDNENINSTSISVEGITALLLRLDTKMSPGSDNIPNTLLKVYSDQVARLLVIIFQKSIDSVSLPEDWRVARAILVFKKGSQLEVDNYRHISCISSSCKMFQHILAKYINDFLTKENILTDGQHHMVFGINTRR